MKEGMNDKVRIAHIVDAISEVEKYLLRCTYDDFLANSGKRYATIKQVDIMGEACNRISQAFKHKHSEIEWKSINGFRNISIHEYFGVDNQIVWEIDQNDLPVLKAKFSDAEKKL